MISVLACCHSVKLCPYAAQVLSTVLVLLGDLSWVVKQHRCIDIFCEQKIMC